MAILTWTEEAERWLRDIHDYIAVDNPATAMRVVNGIHSKAQILLEFPEIGYRYLVEQRWEVRDPEFPTPRELSPMKSEISRNESSVARQR